MSAKRSDERIYPDVNASPVKSFFVTMLTRDISLSDAILDLLDNCVDGILRMNKSASEKEPYKGFHTEIKFNEDSFSISDNCGGIPWSHHEYAFRMGRPPSRPHEKTGGTVGTYGIGMKRAIFKIGQECLISTQSGDDNYEVEITTAWLSDEENWCIPVRSGKKPASKDGTTIVIGKLHSGISSQFGHDKASFSSYLVKKVATHYAFIISKGFEVRVNGEKVSARPTQLVFLDTDVEGRGIRPYLYKTEIDGVQVFLAVGFTRPIPSQEEVENELEERKYSSRDAGWTVVCNDRAVLYCDKSELTGWGEASVPLYHPQFIAIAGIVEFQSNDPSKLPTTTTKRGIDASSSLFLQVKNKMREGMSLFINYTNKWKGDVQQSKKHMKSGQILSFDDIKIHASRLRFTIVKKGAGGEQYRPSLPLPTPKFSTRRKIIFVKDIDDIRLVGRHLADDPDADPNAIGERCFDEILREAKK